MAQIFYGIDSFYSFFEYYIAYTVINFVMTLFALYIFEKMSKAVWSKKLPEEELSRKTSQMDREVAAGWFDLMLLDMDFKFMNFKHNIPDESNIVGNNRKLQNLHHQTSRNPTHTSQ